jgi:hypothetical protein
MKKGMYLGILGTLFLGLPASVHAQVFTYTDEASYLNDLVSLGYGTLQEGFEENATWGGTRFPNTASAVTSVELPEFRGHLQTMDRRSLRL